VDIAILEPFIISSQGVEAKRIDMQDLFNPD
jgi:hypothetical protein